MKHPISDGGSIASGWFVAVLLLVISWCTYLHVPLESGGRLLVPSFPTVALAPLIFLVVQRNLTSADLVFVLKVAFVLLLSIAISPGYAHVQEKLFSMIQFVMAVAVAIMIIKLMQQLPRASCERVLLVLWCLIVVGSILETFGIIRDASDSFRAWAYESTYGLYDADLRDVNMVGWTRPKLFSEEPSHLTKFFIAAINAWLLIRVTAAKAVVAAIATLVMVVIMGSPMLLVSAVITVAILVWNQRARMGARLMSLIVVLMIGAVVGANLGDTAFSNITTRITRIDDMSDESVERMSGDERRVILPYSMLVETWLGTPLFGVGIGGKEVLAQRSGTARSSSSMIKGNNALADIGIYLGIVGGTMFMVLLWRQARRSGVMRMGLLTVIFVLFSQLMGGIDTFRFWGFIALLWGALTIADRTENVERVPGNHATLKPLAGAEGAG